MEDIKKDKTSNFWGKSILVVEDERDLREILVSNLKQAGFKIYEANEGLSAKTVIALNCPDIILSDIRMPSMNGIELLNHVKRTTKIPFILMTGFSEVMETQQAFKLGADNFLLKPFTKAELIDALTATLSKVKGDEQRDVAATSLYCRIPIDDFTTGSNLKVDIYLKLSEQKYIRVAKRSFELSMERLTHFKSKGLNFFYIKKEDFTKYVGLNINVSKVIGDAENVTKQQKMHVLKHTAEVLLQDTYVNGLDKVRFSEAKEVVGLVIEAMAEDDDLGSLIEMLNTNSDYLYSHSLGVSLYSSMIADALGWNSTLTKFKVSMGGLLHDIGKKEIDQFILEKPRKDLNRHELQILESHAMRGRDILSQIPTISSDIAVIALQHHENCLGRGYPGALQKDQIHPLARLVAMANRFCELALKGPHWTPLSPLEAIDRILALNEHEFDGLFMAALMNIFNHPKASQYQKWIDQLKSKVT